MRGCEESSARPQCDRRSAGHSLGPDDGVVELGVDGLQVLQRWALVQHPFVEGQREAGIDELPVVQSLGRGGDTGSWGTPGPSPGARKCSTLGH